MAGRQRKLRVAAVYGGAGFGLQLKALRRGVDVLVACPGRLTDLMERGEVRLDAVEIVVVDEADRMADMGFLPVVQRLLDATPKTRQTLLFSATLDGAVDTLVRRYQRNPVRHVVAGDRRPTSRAPPTSSGASTRDKRVRALRRCHQARGPDDRLLHDEARHRPHRQAVSTRPACAPRRSTATAPRASASARSRRSPRARSTRSSPPTSPHAASTSTPSPVSCTSIRRTTPRTTCTVRAAPHAPEKRARWCRSSGASRHARRRNSSRRSGCHTGSSGPTARRSRRSHPTRSTAATR